MKQANLKTQSIKSHIKHIADAGTSYVKEKKMTKQAKIAQQIKRYIKVIDAVPTATNDIYLSPKNQQGKDFLRAAKKAEHNAAKTVVAWTKFLTDARPVLEKYDRQDLLRQYPTAYNALASLGSTLTKMLVDVHNAIKNENHKSSDYNASTRIDDGFNWFENAHKTIKPNADYKKHIKRAGALMLKIYNDYKKELKKPANDDILLSI